MEKKQEPAVTQLAPSRKQLAEYVRNIWHVVPEVGTPLEAVLMPHYFAHVARDFKRRDRIEVEAEDGSYLAELVVLDCGFNFAKCEILWRHEFKANQVPAVEFSGFEFKWRGPKKKWSVVRKSDNTVLKDEFDTTEAAVNWATAHAKVAA